MGWASRLSREAKLEERKAELRRIARSLGTEEAINRYLRRTPISPRQRAAFHAVMLDGLADAGRLPEPEAVARG